MLKNLLKDAPIVMGIINATSDSFSGDGLLQGEDPVKQAVLMAKSCVSEGAAIIDIGAESTRPGAKEVSAEEEQEALLPILSAIKKEVNTIISVDTYRASTASLALEHGADMINDVWGFKQDPELMGVIANHSCPIVITHNRSATTEEDEKLGNRQVDVDYQDLIPDMLNELQEITITAKNNGISKEQIILDPGIGFGKTTSQNLQIVKHLNTFKELGFPVLIGTSRKSFIGYTLDLPADERLEGTAATVALATERGADIIRVHDVKFMKRIIDMTKAVIEA